MKKGACFWHVDGKLKTKCQGVCFDDMIGLMIYASHVGHLKK
jgi:hypothetical protein